MIQIETKLSKFRRPQLTFVILHVIFQLSHRSENSHAQLAIDDDSNSSWLRVEVEPVNLPHVRFECFLEEESNVAKFADEVRVV